MIFLVFTVLVVTMNIDLELVPRIWLLGGRGDCFRVKNETLGDEAMEGEVETKAQNTTFLPDESSNKTSSEEINIYNADEENFFTNINEVFNETIVCFTFELHKEQISLSELRLKNSLMNRIILSLYSG